MELKICISPQFRAIDPPNPARGFIQQNENVRFATAACMQKYGNVSFATVACAKCMRYGGRGGGPIPWGGGGWQHGTRNHIYIYGSPPQGPPEREGMYHLPSVVLNAFKDMLRKHCKFQCFMHILLVVFC